MRSAGHVILIKANVQLGTHRVLASANGEDPGSSSQRPSRDPRLLAHFWGRWKR